MNKECDSKKWNIAVLSVTIAVLLLIAFVTVLVDPFLHYHLPLKGLEYPLNDERYINDGLARYYPYSAVITGSSTSQNFMASQFESLWGTKTIKQTYAGGTNFEVNSGLERAFSHNQDIKYVLRGLDLTRLSEGKEEFQYDGIPTYLYDKNPFNDVSYLLNKEVVPLTFAVVNYTRAGNKTTTMDEYAAWYPYATYGREQVLAGLIDYSSFTEEVVLSEEDREKIRSNVRNNMLQIALDHPDTEFYYFYTPASGAYWYGMLMTKQLNVQIEAEKICTEILLQADNIHLFGYADRYEITTNLDNYMDTLHFSKEIGDQVMTWIYEGEGQLTKENYEEYYERIKTIYTEFDYDYE